MAVDEDKRVSGFGLCADQKHYVVSIYQKPDGRLYYHKESLHGSESEMSDFFATFGELMHVFAKNKESLTWTP